MFEIRDANAGDVDTAVTALADAFAPDPLFGYFFEQARQGVRAASMTFLSILLRVRLSLGMPAYVLVDEGEVRGVVMGYDTSRPTWPAPLAEEWNAFRADAKGLEARLAAYEHISDAHIPSEAHYYLGVIGVHPSLQGKGAGKALLDTFCALSGADPGSKGVYLDTGSPHSLQFYLRNGFEVRGEARLGAVPLWCVYKRT